MYQPELYNESRPNVGVTVVPFIYEDKKIKVLLYKRSATAEVFADYYSLPNRFFDIRDFDSLEDTAMYALEEKTNVKIPYIVPFHTFSGLYIDPTRIVTINSAFYSILRKEDVISTEHENSFDTEWINIDDALKLNLAFNHNEVLSLAWERLTNSAEYTTKPIRFLPEKFTISDLKELTELLINDSLDNSRFRDRISKSGILIKCEGEMEKKVNHRPSQLFKYNKDYSGYFYPKSLTKSN